MEMEIDQLIRSKRRTIGIEINREGKLIVRAPMRCSQKAIDSFINTKWRWILKHQRVIKERVKHITPLRFVDGEKIHFLGDVYPLKIVECKEYVLRFENNTFFLSSDSVEYGRDIFIEWFRRQGKVRIPQRVEEFAQVYGFKYHQVKITKALKRWGSCTAKGNLNFTWRLMMTPPEIIDYIIVHELAHLKQLNHSKRYWEIVEAIMPDYREREKWLSENGVKMII
jgi:predicted metal-dependent hydrolase